MRSLDASTPNILLHFIYSTQYSVIVAYIKTYLSLENRDILNPKWIKEPKYELIEHYFFFIKRYLKDT